MIHRSLGGGAEQRSFSERGSYPADLVPALDRRAWLQSDVGVELTRSGETLSARAFSLIDGTPHGVCTGAVADPSALFHAIGRLVRERAAMPAAVLRNGPEPKRIPPGSYATADVLPVTLLRYASQPLDPERADDLFDRLHRDVGYERHRRAVALRLQTQARSASTNDPALRLHATHLLRSCVNFQREAEPISLMSCVAAFGMDNDEN